MAEFTFIRELVEHMNEHTILEYNPQRVIVDIVENFWLKKHTKESLLEFEIQELEYASKFLYERSFPNADPELMEEFAAEVTFYLAFRLSEQGSFGPVPECGVKLR